MKVSVNWVKEYVEFSASPAELAEKLTMAGVEVEAIEKVKGDTVFVCEVTPNRPDCLNMIGVAREFSALLNKTLRIPSTGHLRFPRKPAPVTILDKMGCLRYIGTLVKGVKIASSPPQISKRLEAVGLRTINNVVDITNFCLLETGQPLHAFDYDKLMGGRIIVRRAREGERITTLDGEERTLDSSILVIADQERPVAIAGIIGGKETEVTTSTKNILLESAYFDPVWIRQASRRLGISTDSSYRFERGVDREMVKGGADRALSLMMRWAGGRITHYRDVYPGKNKFNKTNGKISISIPEVNHFLGAQATQRQCIRILSRLGCHVVPQVKDRLFVQPPSFRSDLRQKVDIMEELARIFGYDRLSMSIPEIKISRMTTNPQRIIRVHKG